MIINHNLPSMNAQRNMGINNNNASNSMEKLSSGLRINRAGDDAAGLAISEKMRAQIRGLDQASSNAQNGISMIQTAEGALNETHSILQRMRELATQASNDTNVGVDRNEIQKEINQLSSEINRIGNTTEFNTQSLLKGSSTVNLDKTNIASTTGSLAGGEVVTTEAKQLIAVANAVTTASILDGKSYSVTLNGQQLTINFASDTSATLRTAAADTANATANSITIKFNSGAGAGSTVLATTLGKSIQTALATMIQKNDTLAGNYSVAASSTDDQVLVSANKSGSFAGDKGAIADSSAAVGTIVSAGTESVGTTNNVKAFKDVDFTAFTSTTLINGLVGKGFTIAGKQVEFYDANDGVYTGNAIGVNVASATNAATLVAQIADQLSGKIDGVTFKTSADTGTMATGGTAQAATAAGHLYVEAAQGGVSGNSLSTSDGGVQSQFKATFQVGANQGQQMTIDINDMRSLALQVTGQAGSANTAVSDAKYTSANSVTNGTDSVTREAALDVSSASKATAAIKVINNAIESVSSERSKLGAFQNRLEHTINNLGTSSENLSAAESRIRDVDMAKEMSQYSKNNILAQAAQAMLAQANQQPQQVLQLLR